MPVMAPSGLWALFWRVGASYAPIAPKSSAWEAAGKDIAEINVDATAAPPSRCTTIKPNNLPSRLAFTERIIRKLCHPRWLPSRTTTLVVPELAESFCPLAGQ